MYQSCFSFTFIQGQNINGFLIFMFDIELLVLLITYSNNRDARLFELVKYKE
jgi:hypothetical protein